MGGLKSQAMRRQAAQGKRKNDLLGVERHSAIVFTRRLLDQLVTGRPLRLRGAFPRGRPTIAALFRDEYERNLADRPREYVFKNEIANQLFLARHNPDRSGLLTEFNVGNARLDLVVANGTTTCYEIKTDRDELRRLDSQIDASSTVFDRTYVVTTPRFAQQVESIIDTRPHVGYYLFEDGGRLRRIRAAKSHAEHVDVHSVFDCLRRGEYTAALYRRFGRIPTVPNTRVYAACKALFDIFSPAEAHKILADALRRRSCRKGDRIDHRAVPREALLLYFGAHPRKRAAYADSNLYQQLTTG